jgi:hypothetical protein
MLKFNKKLKFKKFHPFYCILKKIVDNEKISSEQGGLGGASVALNGQYFYSHKRKNGNFGRQGLLFLAEEII